MFNYQYHTDKYGIYHPMDLSFLLSPRLFPEWRVYSEFINDHLSRALKLDAKLSSHAIEVECPDANQINQVKNWDAYIHESSKCYFADLRRPILLQGSFR